MFLILFAFVLQVGTLAEDRRRDNSDPDTQESSTNHSLRPLRQWDREFKVWHLHGSSLDDAMLGKGPSIPSCCACHQCDGCQSVPGAAAATRRLSLVLQIRSWTPPVACRARVPPGLAARASPSPSPPLLLRAPSSPATRSKRLQPRVSAGFQARRHPGLQARHRAEFQAVRTLPVARTVGAEPEDDKRYNSIQQHFERIRFIRRIGILCWDPTNLPVKSLRDATVHDILQGLRQQRSKPDQLVALDSSIILPMTFPDLRPQLVPRIFPFDAGFIVPLHVAMERGVDLRTVDFIIGGSSLKVLADRHIDRYGTNANVKYLVQKCPTTDIIMIAKNKIYNSNYADVGFQYERLLTGRPLDDKIDLRIFESLQLVKVAGYTVLITAEIDAVDDSGQPIKLRSGNPRYIATKALWQMVASGSETLIMGDRCGSELRSVTAKTFDDMVFEDPAQNLAVAEDNIVRALEKLKQSAKINADVPIELDFRRGRMSLRSFPGDSLLPSVSVVEELLDTMTIGNYRPQQPEAKLQLSSANRSLGAKETTVQRAKAMVRTSTPPRV